MATIRSGNELADVLNKALQIELGFESSSIWEGYIEVKTNEFRELLFTLSSDSHEHAQMIEELLKMVKVGTGRGSPPLQERRFNFANMKEGEIMNQLLRYDRLALDLYVGIKEALTSTDARSVLIEGEIEDFMSILDKLIRDERRHVNLIVKYVGMIERIR